MVEAIQLPSYSSLMKIFLGDFRLPIECEIVSYARLQNINDNPKESICGLYDSENNKIYITDDSTIPALDILMHELSHAIIDEQKTLKTEEHKADIMAIRLKNLMLQRENIYVFTKRGVHKDL
tara:strand:- start:910 stop:1278 length:369 start_codon:yes stop_codon:yes gene_type:complete